MGRALACLGCPMASHSPMEKSFHKGVPATLRAGYPRRPWECAMRPRGKHRHGVQTDARHSPHVTIAGTEASSRQIDAANRCENQAIPHRTTKPWTRRNFSRWESGVAACLAWMRLSDGEQKCLLITSREGAISNF